MTTLGDLIEVQTNSAAINFEQGLEQPELVATFSPTHSAVVVLRHILQAVRPNATANQRAMNWFGTYGAGKSRLAVLVGRMLEAGVAGKEFEAFLDRLADSGEERLRKELQQWFLDKNDEDARPYLLVPIYGNRGTSISNSLVEALYRAIETRTDISHTELLSDSEFEVTLRRLEEILGQKPELGDEFLPNLGISDSPYLRAVELRDGLSKHQPQAIAVFATWHKRVCFGAAFDPEDHGAANVVDLYREASRGLAKKGYRGIAIIWDEFGNSLEDLLRNPTRVPIQEVMDLQRFVETVCMPPEGHVLFMGLTHVGLAEYASRASAGHDVKERLATIEGRFTPLQIELRAAEAEGYHLLGNQIVRTPLGRELLAEADGKSMNVVLECQRLPLFSQLTQELQYVTTACYPLHPVAAAGLLALSVEHAQATRTAFTFFADFAARGELGRRVIDPAALFGQELIRFPELLQYYEERIRAGRIAGGLALFARNVAQSQSSGATPEQNAERRAVLTCLTLATLLGQGFQCNDAFLAIALHDSEFGGGAAATLRETMTWLSDAGLIWKNEATGFWNLGGDATVNPESLIEVASARISGATAVELLRQYPQIAEELFPLLGQHDLDPSTKGIVRSYAVKLASPHEAITAQLERSQSAAIILALPKDPAESDEIRLAIASRPNALIFVVLPMEGVAGLVEILRRYMAIRAVLEQPQSEALKGQLMAKLEQVRLQLASILSEMYGREGFNRGEALALQFGKEQPLRVASWQALRLEVQRCVDGEFTEELMVRVAQNGRNRSFQENLVDSKTTISIVERVIDFDSNPAYRNDLLGFADASETAAIVDGILGANEAFITNPGGVALRKPDQLHGAMKSVVDAIRGEVLRRRPSPYNMTELVRKLSLPPYGVPAGAVPIFVGLALREDVSRLIWSPPRQWHQAEFICKALASDQFAVRFADFAQKHLNILEVVENGMRQRLDISTPAIGDKHARGREAIKSLKDHVFGFGDSVLDAVELDRGARTLVELLRTIGKSPHEIADVIGALIDPEGTLTGATPQYEDKVVVRERFNLLLDEFDRVTNARVTDFVQDLRGAVPPTEDEDARDKWLARLGMSSPLGEAVAASIGKGPIDQDVANQVAPIVLGKALTDCSAAELGRISGVIAALATEHSSLKSQAGDDNGYDTADSSSQIDFEEIQRHREAFSRRIRQACDDASSLGVDDGELTEILVQFADTLKTRG